MTPEFYTGCLHAAYPYPTSSSQSFVTLQYETYNYLQSIAASYAMLCRYIIVRKLTLSQAFRYTYAFSLYPFDVRTEYSRKFTDSTLEIECCRQESVTACRWPSQHIAVESTPYRRWMCSIRYSGQRPSFACERTTRW